MVTIRPAKLDDLEAADALVVAIINDLTMRHGFGQIANPSPPRLQRFSLADDPDGLWVAEHKDELVGFGFSWACDELWFLAQLFVNPDAQSSGVGRELLAKTLAHGAQRDARAKALITFAFNRAAQGLYMRHGLYPITPLYVMSAGLETVAARPLSTALRVEPLEGSIAPPELLRPIDRAALGFSRAKHHSYMLTEGGLTGKALWAGANCVGYFYVGPDGHIGPLAVTTVDHVADAFAAALLAVKGTPAKQVSAFVPASIPAVLDLALRLGMRITLPMLLMADGLQRPWDRYMPRNPGLM
ncbi:GNAT family N-acetyltransferase [Alsobacter soli]|uniref:GNAT family N-acetyltransferase n=1 Tax=Alsobacter soli TaxID=2109933 RepID=A0A2T1HY20_9HYPH|nr:GNAT family N-acetyltransferase [Alsobacter soli]PSC06586.1 GNAT family N-acetyltransferase [Alsobacter soli]